jgi:glycosyltransferase involved in cell wall biosynthesis
MNDIALAADHFGLGLDTEISEDLFVGKGIVLPLRGWCYSAAGPVRRLDLLAGDRVLPVPNHSWARTDVFARECPQNDPGGFSLMSGFDAFLPIPAIETAQPMELRMRATLRGGAVVERPLLTLRLHPRHGAIPTQVTWPASGPRVAICMATYRPPLTLFKAQIESLQAQTHANFVCIISDDGTEPEHFVRARSLVENDSRFILFQNPTRLNFYLNFQESLRRVPADAEFIALCDQDDVWHPEKLQALLDGFKPEDQLVYSDARLVDQNGRLHSETFWNRRRNNHTDLATLMVANTVTGAACMMRACLLPDILPLPTPVGPAFHDHWIGLVALTKASIGYVRQPLYDYVQHDAGVIGHNYYDWPGIVPLFKQVIRPAPDFGRMAHTATLVLKQATEDYIFVLQKIMLARTLLLRNPATAPAKRAALLRFTRFETSLRAVYQEKTAAKRAKRPTLNLESMFFWSAIGMRLRNLAFRAKRRAFVKLQTRSPGRRMLDALIAPGAAVPPPETGPGRAEPQQPYAVPVLEYGIVRAIYHNISPLKLEISADHPRRVNLLLATINFDYVFGGYIGMFNLALRLKHEGFRVRIILHEDTDWNPREWKRRIQDYPGLTTLFDEVEITLRFDRTVPIEVNPQDRFVATNCWAAHIAHHTAAQLEETRFLFMVQEYEPFFLPMNSISALFQQAYTFPQLALFSTELLQDFFRRDKIGVFAHPGGEAKAAVFSNAIQKFYPTRELLTRTRRRLLFYARPEEHAARNLFELGMIVLAELVRDKRVDLTGWSFHGIGSAGEGKTLELAPGVPLELVPKTNLEEYIRLMSSFDVGLSLMLTPHPSLVPLEMAAAGMWTVTNTFANKTARELQRISTNLIGVEPSIPAIKEGLVEAMRRVDEIAERLDGARMQWPTDWDNAFPEQSLQLIRNFLGPGE